MNFSFLFANDIKIFFPEIFLAFAILLIMIYGVFLATSLKYNYPLISRNIYFLTLYGNFILNNFLDCYLYTMFQEASNIKDLFNEKLNFTIETNNLIKQFGGKYIKRMIIVRTPLSMPMPQSLNAVSGFNFF